VALFVLVLLTLALGGLYTATAVIVHVDNVVLLGEEVPLPRPVARILPGLDPKPAEGSPGTTRVNILVLGVDRRPHHDQKIDGPPNADSIHILSLDPVSKTATTLSLPRDLYIEAPSPDKSGEFIETRINQTFKLGEEAKYPGGGAAYAKRVVEYTFHLPIDYYAVIDWVAFADVIDALGGVWINVPVEMRDVQGFNPRTGHSFKLTFTPGYHYMDSIGALAYARHRDDDQNDFGRIQRQQEVMRSAADEALRGGWLGSAPKLYDRFKSAITTDLSNARLPGLVLLAKQIGIENVRMVSLAGKDTEAVRRVVTPWGEDVLVPRWEVMGTIIRDAIDDRALRGEGATVSVINASGVRGQDERAVEYLRRFLLAPEAISTGTAAPTTPPTAGSRPVNAARAPAASATTISYTGTASETAARVAGWLGVPNATITADESGPGAPAAVLVTLGSDVRLPDDARFLRYRTR
jgi:LCP family protein required for cell wall assembly